MRQYTAILLIALISVAAAEKSPANAVLQRIDSLVQSSRNEQAEQTRIYLGQHTRCEEEKVFRTKEINDASVSAGAADQQLQLCNAEVPIATAARKQSKAELGATKQQLQALNVEYSIFQDSNLQRQQQHQEAINNIQTAYNIIGGFANGKQALKQGTVFLEVTQKINSVFKTALKHGFHQEMVPVMSALVQITQQAPIQVSTSSLTKVVSLLRSLESNVKKSEENRVSEWNKYVALFNKQKALLEQQITSLNTIINKYDKYLENLKTCIRTETQVLRLANAKKSRNSQILEASVVMCDAFESKYKLQTKERSEYVTLLGQLRSFIVNAISSYNSGLYSKGDFVNQAQISSH